MHYEEIGEMAGRAGGGQELKNSMHYGEIKEIIQGKYNQQESRISKGNIYFFTQKNPNR